MKKHLIVLCGALLLVMVLSFVGNSTVAFASSAYAGSLSSAKLISVTTVPMFVNCKQHPSSTILKNWAKYDICGYGTSSSMRPNGISAGDCGTVTNEVYNNHAGQAKFVTTISPSWYSGGMFKAYYSGWYTSSSGLSGGVTNINTWPIWGPSFNWSDTQFRYTDTGSLNFEVNSESANTALLGECTLSWPIDADTTITA